MKKHPSKSTTRRRRSAAAGSRSLSKPVGARHRPIKGAQHHEIGGVVIDAVAAANGQVKRVVYPPGFRWSTHMKSVIGTDLCMHGHVGFLTSGRVRVNTVTAARSTSRRRPSSWSSPVTTPGSSDGRPPCSFNSTPRARPRSASACPPNIATPAERSPGRYSLPAISRPARSVVRTRASARMSCAGSPWITTMSASSPAASRPVRAAAPKRAAGAVVSEARICG